MLRTAFVLLSGNMATSILTLARNLAVARLLPIADYGIAATFAIVMAVIEMASALGLQQQIVQAKDGDDPYFQASLQGFQALRGTLAAGALVVLAGPFALFLGVPEVADDYRVLALVPLLNGFVHFDIYRMNRRMQFRPMMLSMSIPALLSFLAVWPLFGFFGDYRVMLWSIVLQILLTVVISHVLAERRYKMTFDRAIMRRNLEFGWPLLINGMLLFAVFNGDRVIVGRELGMEALAIFSMGVTLTLTPTLVMAKSAQTFFLPHLTRAAHKDRTGRSGRFAGVAAAALQASLLNGAILMLGIGFVGRPLVVLVLGEEYAALAPLLIWLGMLHALRVFKSGCAVVALSQGMTGNSLQSNLVRVASLPLVWLVLSSGGDLFSAIMIAIGAEIAGYALSLWLIRRRIGLRLSGMTAPLLTITAFIAVSLLIARSNNDSATYTILLPVLVFGVAVASLTDFRRFATKNFNQNKKSES